MRLRSILAPVLGRVSDPPLLFALLTLLALPAPSQAQAPDRAAFITRLGNDTVAVESFTRTADRLVGDRVIRAPRVSLLHYEATLGPDGTVASFEASSRPGNRLDLPALESARIEIHGDSAVVQLRQADNTRSYVVHIRPGAVPMLNSTYALYGQMTRQFARQQQDSMPVDMIMPGVLTPVPTMLTRLAPDSVAIDYYGNPLEAKVDSSGRLLGLSGARTTVKVRVTRRDSADVVALAHALAAVETRSGPLGQLSPRDTVRATVAGAQLMVDYGRPHVRGRKIFGGIVPFGEVWRTGANAATQFSTDRPLVFGRDTLAPGSYTLWTLPTATNVSLIFNRQTGQWGTEYDPSQDVFRVPMERLKTPAPVEVFTIRIEPAGQGEGMLVFEWAEVRWEARFKA
ncbi:MAG TPA: DUF2911 domain-containing protein [Gemmatimonadales bacterium]|nr:DUF2911 domain-containing protein [Gemmatimonadales bacterium]